MARTGVPKNWGKKRRSDSNARRERIKKLKRRARDRENRKRKKS
jgi:hypothetical protein